MAILKVLVLGDPILRSRSLEVTVFDDALAALARDMHETMAAAPGIGLAAPQVGVLKRMFTFDSGDEGESGAVVNPEITWSSAETVEMEEGCLSVPGQYFPLTRPKAVRMRAQDLTGTWTEREFDGLLARIFQHETDHLDGILFVDRLAPDVRKRAMKALRDQDFGMSPPPRRDKSL